MPLSQEDLTVLRENIVRFEKTLEDSIMEKSLLGDEGYPL